MRHVKARRHPDKRNITVVGVGLGPDDLTPKHRAIIDSADILVGGRRLLALFPDSRAEKKLVGKDIKEVIAYIRKRMGPRSIVVLASGDPLLHGIGAKLIKAFGSGRVDVYPNVSSIAAAFARIKEPWDDTRIISLHGKKNEKALLEALRSQDKVALLTDPEHHPGWLARLLMEKGLGALRMCVLEALGTPSERMGWYELSRAADRKFAEPNIVVLKRAPEPAAVRRTLALGTPDEWFDHHQGLITKSEVRAVALAKLRLQAGQVLWDLGAGSGSIAIESSLFIGKGKIVAVEKDPRRVLQIKANAKRFGVRNLRVVQAVMPDQLKRLPKPDRIFIGGGGRNLPPIISEAVRHLRPNGIVVINAVLLQNLHDAATALRRLGFTTEMVQVQILRSEQMPWSERLDAFNPVWIITGIRTSEGGGRKRRLGSGKVKNGRSDER